MNIKIDRIDNFGRGIGYLNGKVVFVPNALIGEEVKIKIKEEKKNYIEAELLSVILPSPKRIEPICPYFLLCGGCTYMHTTYDNECSIKENNIKNLFNKKFGKEVIYIKCDNEINYRNKITLRIFNYEYGYYKENSHEFVKVDKCLLAKNKINEFILNHKIVKEGIISIRCNYLDELLINIKSDNEVSLDNIPDYVKGIILNDKLIYGNDYFIDKINDIEYKISYDSFFQINNCIAGKIINILKDNIKGINLLDLYCGVGTLSIGLKDNFKNIYGVEIVKNSIDNANFNANLNKLNNAKYICGDSGIFNEEFNEIFDTVLLDPPRSGLNKKTIEEVLNIKTTTIAYVSCNHQTLIRDLDVLKEHYNIEKIYALDMFPRSYHVECVCILKEL